MTATPLPSSYGTAAGVGAIVPRYAGNTGDFTGTFSPTDVQVCSFIDKTSALLNVILSDHGFAIPITEPNSILACEAFIEEEVASIIEGINGSGRFGPVGAQVGSQNRIPSSGRFGLVTSDIQNFVQLNALGFERMGCIRTQAPTEQISYIEMDQSGQLVPPLFERKAFRNIAQEWDNP